MKVSVITVVYNNKETIKDTIESVLSQDYPDKEHIIIDGKSTDGTLEIIKSYGNKIKKVISEHDKGLYDAMNKGIKYAKGDIIGFLNADDVYYDSKVVTKIVDSFNENIDCIYGNLVYVNRFNTNKITRRWISRDFKKGLFEMSWTVAHPTFYCRKKIYNQYGGYRTDFKISSDTDLMYRFLEKYQIKSKFVNHYFVKMRDSGISTQGLKSTLIIIKEAKRIIKENGGNFNLIRYLFFKFLKIEQILFKKRL